MAAFIHFIHNEFSLFIEVVTIRRNYFLFLGRSPHLFSKADYTYNISSCLWAWKASSQIDWRWFSLSSLLFSKKECKIMMAFKSFCLRDRGRLGNRGRPIWLKFGTLSYYGDLCSMPKFQLHCSYLGWVLDVTLFGVPQCFFYSPFWALFNTLITMSGIF